MLKSAADRAFLGSTEIVVFEDRVQPGAWRVEQFDDDGGCSVRTFVGPDAEARARAYFDALKSGDENPAK